MRKAMTLTNGAMGDEAITCPCSRLVYTENKNVAICPSCGRRYSKIVEWIMLEESPPPLGIHVTDGVAGKDKIGG